MKQKIGIVVIWVMMAALLIAVIVTSITDRQALQTIKTVDKTTTSFTAALRVNLNTATAKELMQVPLVGPATAEKIIGYRERCGGFRSLDELLDIEGIGVTLVEKWSAYFVI